MRLKEKTEPLQKPNSESSQIKEQAKQFAKILKDEFPIKPRSRKKIFTFCKAILEKKLSKKDVNPATLTFFNGLSQPELHYWVSNLYAELLPSQTRKKLAAYFTPPYLADMVLEKLKAFGLRLESSTILDPSSGGAAFLVPLAQRVKTILKKDGLKPHSIIQHINEHLVGYEIEPYLGKLSVLLLNDLLKNEIQTAGTKLHNVLTVDTLKASPKDRSFDAIVGNPPYGRILSPSKACLEEWSDGISYGHVNAYALFILQSLKLVKPGGYIGLIVPTSFIGGTNFGALRKTILESAQVLAIDLIQERHHLFLGVIQDICIIYIKKKPIKVPASDPTCCIVEGANLYKEIGKIHLPLKPSTRSWVMPDETTKESTSKAFFSKDLYTLEDYGFESKVGYFVWNREKDRHREARRSRKGEIPLIWAHTVKPNQPCYLSTHRHSKKVKKLKSFVSIGMDSPAVLKKECIILQRTSNKKQDKRLVAGYIPRKLIGQYGGVITENHTIVLFKKSGVKASVSTKQLCALLNSTPVDQRYRQLSGTANISVRLLRDTPLPDPNVFLQLVSQQNALIGIQDFDELVKFSYLKTKRKVRKK